MRKQMCNNQYVDGVLYNVCYTTYGRTLPTYKNIVMCMYMFLAIVVPVIIPIVGVVIIKKYYPKVWRCD